MTAQRSDGGRPNALRDSVQRDVMSGSDGGGWLLRQLRRVLVWERRDEPQQAAGEPQRTLELDPSVGQACERCAADRAGRARQPTGQRRGDQGGEVVESALDDQVMCAVGVAGVCDEDLVTAQIDLDGLVALAEAQQHAAAQLSRMLRPQDRAALDEREHGCRNRPAAGSPEANLRLL